MADVHAAGESQMPVDDEDFAVVAEIDGGHAPRLEQRGGQKAGEGNPRAPQFMRDGRPGIARAGGVHQHAHGHPALDGALKRGDELLAGRVVVENVADEREGNLGRVDGGEHGGEGLVAVDERQDFVAGRERALDDAADHAGEQLQMFRAFVLRFTEVVRHRARDGLVHTEGKRAAPDTIDAEDEVDHRPDDRHEPDDPDPKCGGAGIALMEQGMTGGKQGGHEVEARHQMRPELGEVIEPVHRRLLSTEAGSRARRRVGFHINVSEQGSVGHPG